MPRVTRRLIALLLRSRVLVRSAMLLGLVTALAIGASLSLLALTQTPAQLADSGMGSADGSIYLDGSPRPGTPLSSAPVDEAQRAGASDVVPYLTSIGAGATDQGSVDLRFFQTRAPSIATERRIELRDGRWPQQPGECVASGIHGDVTLMPGNYAVKRVGAYTDLFLPESVGVLCAEGTWEQWRVPEGISLAASVMYLWRSSDPQTTARVLAANDIHGRVDTRADVLARSDAPLQEGIAVWPTFALLAIVCVVTAARMERWSRRQRDILWQLGLPRNSLNRSLWVATLASGTLALLAGSALGTVGALAARPLMLMINESKPLRPFAVVPELIVVSLLVGLASLGVGLLLPSGRQQPVKRRRHLPQRWLSVVSVVSAGAFVMLTLIGGSLPLLVLGAVFGVVAVASSVPRLTSWVTARLRAGISPTGLASRISANEQSRLDSMGFGVTLTLGTVATVLTMASTATASVNAANLPALPPGAASVVLSGPGRTPLGADTIQELEKTLNHPGSITVRTLGFVTDTGLVWGVESPQDARRLLPGLDDESLAALEAGQLIVTRRADDKGTVEIDNSLQQQAVVSTHLARVSATQRFSVGGLALTSAVPWTDGEITKVYYGIGDKDMEAGRIFVANNALELSGVTVFKPSDVLTAPVWVIAAAVAVGFVVAVFTGLMLRQEVRLVAPSLGGLRALGLARRWVVGCVTAMACLILLPALAGTVVASLLPVLLQLVVLPGAGTLGGIPWLGLAAMCAAVLLGGVLGSMGAVRHASVAERSLE